TGNGDVTFSGNTASGRYAYGGAIYGDSSSTITLSDNGSVSFSGNTASGRYAYGGAIYTQGDLSIRNNDSVEFYKNAEVSGNTYRLRSIYAYDGNGGEISLSAAAGKSITFYDSVYIGSDATVNLNQDYAYQAENGSYVTIRQQGDIIFTGADTEQHLNDLLEADGAGRVATAEEILNSRTTEVCAMTNLYGGRLRVEEGAIYQGQGITAMEGSAATVRVQNATLSHSGYDLTFNAGTKLEVAGHGSIIGKVNMMADSLFKLEQAASLSLHETLGADAAELTVQGTALLAGSSTLNASLTLADGASLDMMSLDAGAVTINGALTFGGKVEMGEHLMAILDEMHGWNESVTLFTGIESLVLPVTVNSEASSRVWVGDVFSNLVGYEQYYFNYVPDVGSLMVVHVPEPTTTTLGLLTLAGLALRRRRK
ncbi:MAG: PEP-CTERM sorting domain-containing protein, partial [Akkermansia sp.]|nr:PEP-CTERM sorting domain-containing protein [Akkermansia sp.]